MCPARLGRNVFMPTDSTHPGATDLPATDRQPSTAGVEGALRTAALGLNSGLLGMDLTSDERFVFHLGHAIYGLTLGAWYGSAVDAD
jgi:hypothetical protein